MGNCYKAQEVQAGPLWWPREVGCGGGGWEGGPTGRGHRQLIHFTVQQKLTQHWKQLYSNKKKKLYKKVIPSVPIPQEAGGLDSVVQRQTGGRKQKSMHEAHVLSCYIYQSLSISSSLTNLALAHFSLIPTTGRAAPAPISAETAKMRGWGSGRHPNWEKAGLAKWKEQLTNIWTLGIKYCGWCRKPLWKMRLMWEMLLQHQPAMLASLIKFPSIPPHQISWDYQGRINSKLLLMNHFTNCIAPTFLFPVTGTSLTDTITDNRGAAPSGIKWPLAHPGHGWEEPCCL